ncbi:hypothetical protein [Caproiciproducens faecalis]|nr:hypothetical protein [Caproiciproducens faecalis]
MIANYAKSKSGKEPLPKQKGQNKASQLPNKIRPFSVLLSPLSE